VRWGPGARTQARGVSRWSSDRRGISRRQSDLRITTGSVGLTMGPARGQVVLYGEVSCPSGHCAAPGGGSGSSGGAARSRVGPMLVLFGAPVRAGSLRQGSSEPGHGPGVVRRFRGGLRQAGNSPHGFSEPTGPVDGRREASKRALRRIKGLDSAPRGEVEVDGAWKSSWLLIRAEGAGQRL
jgi:hypothetical protein